MRKKVLSMVLSLVLVLTMLPLTAFADDDPTGSKCMDRIALYYIGIDTGNEISEAWVLDDWHAPDETVDKVSDSLKIEIKKGDSYEEVTSGMIKPDEVYRFTYVITMNQPGLFDPEKTKIYAEELYTRTKAQFEVSEDGSQITAVYEKKMPHRTELTVTQNKKNAKLGDSIRMQARLVDIDDNDKPVEGALIDFDRGPSAKTNADGIAYSSFSSDRTEYGFFTVSFAGNEKYRGVYSDEGVHYTFYEECCDVDITADEAVTGKTPADMTYSTSLDDIDIGFGDDDFTITPQWYRQNPFYGEWWDEIDDDYTFKEDEEYKVGFSIKPNDVTFKFSDDTIVRINGKRVPCEYDRKNNVLTTNMYATPKISTRLSRTFGCRDFNLGAYLDREGEIKYVAWDPEIATISENGQVKVNGAGTAEFTLIVPESQYYDEASAAIFLDVEPQELIKSNVSLKYTSMTYTGKERKPSVTVKNEAGQTLTKDKDYSVTYSNNTKAGKATVTVSGTGNYTGSVVKTFKIVPKKAVIKSTVAGKKKLTVKMTSSVSAIGGSAYQIAYRKKGTSKWSYTATTEKTKVVKNLKKGKRYYVKVRAYRKVDGTKYYGSWSKTKLSKRVK